MSPPVPDKPYSFCGRKAPRKKESVTFQVSVLWHRRTSVAFIKCLYCGTGARVSPLLSVCIVAQAHECRLPSLISLMVSVDVKHHDRRRLSPFKCPYCGTGKAAFSRVCIVAQAHECRLPTLISLMVSADVKHHERRRRAVLPFRCRYRDTGARVSPLLSVLWHIVWHRRTSVAFQVSVLWHRHTSVAFQMSSLWHRRTSVAFHVSAS